MKILVALSGGVDSSITAKILKDEGHEIIGCYMRLHKNDKYHEENIKKVYDVAKFLGIEVQILNLESEFESLVYKPFVQTYKNGSTPNPCAICNRFIKLGKLLEFAKSMGCEKLATGHYARIENGFLKAGKDSNKDQSYFLANIQKQAIDDVIFPLGDMLKEEVKAIAFDYPELIKIAGAKESSEICFVENSYIDILKQHFDTDKKGIVRNLKNEIVGSHNGYMHYTIGKRRGFSVNGASKPHYVYKIDAKNNEIIVGEKEQILSNEFKISNFNAFLPKDEFQNYEIYAKIRYRSKAIKSNVVFLPNDEAKILLSEPVCGIASGQLCAFYDEFDRVLGSGFIL